MSIQTNMKKHLLSFIVLILSGLFSYAQNYPGCAAGFTFQVNAITNTIQFTNTSSGNNLQYAWSFGDGTSSNIANPTKTYAVYGTWKVCLTVFRTDTPCQNMFCTNITTVNPCNAGWTRSIDTANHLKSYFNATASMLAGPIGYYYFWTFGDGITSTNANPDHIYAAAGKYKVCLKIMRMDSACTNTLCDSIVVAANSTTPVCNAAWTWYADQTTKTKLYFTPSLNSNDYYYAWSFGDGTTSLDKLPTHTYNTSVAKKYFVCLNLYKKDSTQNCHKCDSVSVTPTPVTNNCGAGWAGGADSANKLIWYFKPTQSLPINSATAFYYYWTFGDGTTSTLANPTHAYTQPGRYRVCLKVTRYDSTCTSTLCDSITVVSSPVNVPCNAGFGWQADGVTKQKIYFTPGLNSNDYYYKWTFGDGSTSADKSPTHTFSTTVSKKYYVCLKLTKKDSTQSCTKCDSVLINLSNTNPCNAAWSTLVDSLNRLKWTFYPAVTNSAGTVNSYYYTWTFGDGSSSNLKNPTHTYSQPGRYRVCLKVVKIDSTSMCDKCDSITVLANTNCEAKYTYYRSGNGRELHFTNTSSGSFNNVLWTFGDGTSSNINSPVHLYSANGTYTACLYVFRIINNDTLCRSHRCSTIVVTAVSATNICIANFSFTINPNLRKVEFTNKSTGQNLLYYWTFGDTGVSTVKNPAHIYANNGTYHVCLKVVNAQDTTCTSTLCINIPVYSPIPNPPLAPANFQYSISDPSANTIQFNHTAVAAGQTYMWDFGDGTNSSEENPTHSFNEKNWYLVCFTVTDANGSDVQCQNVYTDDVTTTGIATNQVTSGLQVYPNPFHTELHISFYAAESGEYAIQLIDLSGRLVYHTTQFVRSGVQNWHIPTEQIESGMYVISVQGKSIQMSKKVIK